MTHRPRPRRTRAGIANRHYLVCHLQASRCPSCGSTRRTRYFDRIIVAMPTAEGSHLVVRRCQCLACGTYRKDYSREFLE